MSTTTRPAANEYAPFFEGYISLVRDEDIMAALEGQIGDVSRALAAVPPERERFRYAPDKWSIRELVGHFIDAERVLGYRVLCIARGDQTPLPGFDEQTYARQSRHDEYPLIELIREFETVRSGHLLLLRHLGEAAWTRLGTANANPVSVRALAFIMAGHVRHHLGVLQSRYQVPVGQ